MSGRSPIAASSPDCRTAQQLQDSVLSKPPQAVVIRVLEPACSRTSSGRQPGLAEFTHEGHEIVAGPQNKRDFPDECWPCRPGSRPGLLNAYWTRAECPCPEYRSASSGRPAIQFLKSFLNLYPFPAWTGSRRPLHSDPRGSRCPGSAADDSVSKYSVKLELFSSGHESSTGMPSRCLKSVNQPSGP